MATIRPDALPSYLLGGGGGGWRIRKKQPSRCAREQVVELNVCLATAGSIS